MTRRRSAVLWAALAAALSSAGAAHGGKKECAQAYVDAQRMMKGGQLKKAREQLDVCAREECMAAVRKDCVAWLDQVNASIPSIVAQAKAPDGSDTVEVKLFIDGEGVAERLDVRAIELEPGAHKLRFEMVGQEPIEQEVILRQGERNRVVTATFGGKAAAASVAAPAAARTGDALAAPDRQKSSRVVPIVLGGVALLALGGAGFFWYRAESSRGDLEDARCAPGCSADDVTAIKRNRFVGDVLLGVGLVSAGLAVYFLVSGKPARKASGLWPAPLVRF